MSNSKPKVAPPDSEMYNWSDPRRVGPGVWYMFMLMSCHAQDTTQKAWVCAQIRLFCDYFKCGDCSGHCKEYLNNFPPEEAIKRKEKHALFKWAVTFMNAVQFRLGKPIYDYKIMKKLFTKQEFKFCTADCGQSKPPSAAVHSRSQSRVESVRAPPKPVALSRNAQPNSLRAPPKQSTTPSRNIYRPVATSQSRNVVPVRRQRVSGVMQSAFQMDRI